MRRTITGATCLAVLSLLSATACSGDPSPANGPASASHPASPPSSAPPTAAPRAPSGSPSPPPSWRFTVSGDIPVPPNGSQDTSAAADSSCDAAQFAHDKKVGTQVVGGFVLSGFTASAALLKHFLAGQGTPVGFGPDSRVARLAKQSAPFAALNQQVTTAVAAQLRAGATRVQISSAELRPITFTGSGDLYWGFRNTQGLTVSGSGTRQNGRYTGTLTYVIRDSYGFPAADTLGGFGAPMRYLQTSCGAPGTPGGAHWFPDTITLTVPFTASRS